MKTELRSLPIAEQIIKSTGLNMTYPYDDLVFVEHNPFLLRFNDEKPEQIFIHFNKDCYAEDKQKMLNSMERKAFKLGVSLLEKSHYTMKQEDGSEEITLEFL